MKIKTILKINSKIYAPNTSLIPNTSLDFYLYMPQFLTDFEKKT